MLINNNDYRLAFHESFADLSNELANLKEDMQSCHRITNFYLNIKKPYYKRRFFEIYKGRCCYCGNPILTIDNVEIDHIYSPSKRVNDFENLAPACHYCNNHKSDMVNSVAFANKINPSVNIMKCFKRNEDLSISIRDTYKNDGDVKTFYKALNLSSEIRRIDFLLVYLDDLASHISNKSIQREIKSIRIDLMDKRKYCPVY